MKCRSKKIPLSVFSIIADSNRPERVEREKPSAKHCTLYAKPAFSLVESAIALIILAMVSSSVLVVINRCMASAADSTLRMQAFEVARDNMETLLSGDSVAEMVEYGSSDKYPEVQWQTTVETFYEPITARMWIQGVCSAEYTDTAGDTQTIELTHWLTNLTEEQLRQILEEQEKEKERLAEHLIETEEQAAEYAGVDVQTIRQWIQNGMLKTMDGYYIKGQLDLYKRTSGRPSAEEIKQQAEEDAELLEEIKDKQDEQDKKEKQDEKDEQDQRPHDPNWMTEEEFMEILRRDRELFGF